MDQICLLGMELTGTGIHLIPKIGRDGYLGTDARIDVRAARIVRLVRIIRFERPIAAIVALVVIVVTLGARLPGRTVHKLTITIRSAAADRLVAG